MHFQAIIHHYGYFGVFFIIFIEAIGFPFPAETTLTISGFEWTQGAFKLVPLWLSGALGNIIGSTIAYFIGRYLGRPIVLYAGKYIGITAARLDKANERFEKYEVLVLIIGKFIAGVRILIPYLAGINRMRFWMFWPINAASAIVWSGAFIIAGHYIGLFWQKYHALIHQYLLPSILIACVLVAAWIYFEFRLKRRNRSKEEERDKQ